MKYLAPIIEARRRFLEKDGDDWADKPVCQFYLLSDNGSSPTPLDRFPFEVDGSCRG